MSKSSLPSCGKLFKAARAASCTNVASSVAPWLKDSLANFVSPRSGNIQWRGSGLRLAKSAFVSSANLANRRCAGLPCQGLQQECLSNVLASRTSSAGSLRRLLAKARRQVSPASSARAPSLKRDALATTRSAGSYNHACHARTRTNTHTQRSQSGIQLE